MKKVEEMTIREFLEEVTNTEEIVSNYSHLAKFARHRLEVMDKQNEKRKSKGNSKRTENLELYNTIIKPVLDNTDIPLTVKTIRETLIDSNLTSSKVTAILKLAEKEGLVQQVQPEKKSHPMRYKLVGRGQEEETEETEETEE